MSEVVVYQVGRTVCVEPAPAGEFVPSVAVLRAGE